MVNSLSGLVEPSGFATLLFLLGVACAVRRPTRRYSLVLAAASGLVLLVFSNGLVATLLMSPLEYEYPALHDPTRHPDVRTIVVLTGWAADDDFFPLSAKMNSSSAFRVLEAANLYAARPDCRVLVSGSFTAARIMHQQLQRLGIPGQALLIDSESRNTAESAARVRELLGDAPVFLVSSAGHMRRAMWTFQQQGVRPIAAPTDHLLPKSPRSASWRTSATHLQASDLAAHEYAGLAWYRLRSLSSRFASDAGAGRTKSLQFTSRLPTTGLQSALVTLDKPGATASLDDSIGGDPSGNGHRIRQLPRIFSACNRLERTDSLQRQRRI